MVTDKKQPAARPVMFRILRPEDRAKLGDNALGLALMAASS